MKHSVERSLAHLYRYVRFFHKSYLVSVRSHICSVHSGLLDFVEELVLLPSLCATADFATLLANLVGMGSWIIRMTQPRTAIEQKAVLTALIIVQLSYYAGMLCLDRELLLIALFVQHASRTFAPVMHAHNNPSLNCKSRTR